MRMLTGFIFLLTLFSCGPSSPKTVSAGDKSFDVFFQRFKTDSVFQHSRIKFPLKYTISGEDGDSDQKKEISDSQMKFIGLFVDKGQHGIVTQKQLTPLKTTIKFQIQDTGFEKEFAFERIDLNWYLIAVADNSD